MMRLYLHGRSHRLARMSSSRPNYSAMTVNERLAVAGLIEDFDSAITAGDRQRAIGVLEQVDMDENSAAFTVDTTLGNPSKYGYPRST